LAEAHPQACYTTAFVRAGRVRWIEEHVARLVRDSARMDLAPPEPGAVRDLLLAHAAEDFPAGDGVVRIEARRAEDGRTELIVATRGLGADPPAWTAVVADVVHPGASRTAPAQRTGDPAVVSGRDQATAAAADEALLCDADGFLVEGCRSALAVVLDDGSRRTPPLSRGGVASLTRAVALEHDPELREGDVSRQALGAAREVVALNAVRGARPIVSIDGVPVGDGKPGSLSASLARLVIGGDS
jgi:D-alanine transaminase